MGIVNHDVGERFINFVIRAGYRDEPDIDEDDKPLLHRTTALHLATKYIHSCYLVPELFKIYDRCDVNYIDSNGFTHFHAACANGCSDVVEKFLEFGQDPNCLEQKSVDTPLNLAVRNNHKEVAALLLINGSNPNLVSVRGLTPMLIICMFENHNDDDNLMSMLFELSNDKYRPVQVNTPYKMGGSPLCGGTPLHFALYHGFKKVTELLLKNGADPNLSNEKGRTPLHSLCSRPDDDDLPEVFFKICDDVRLTIQIDAQDFLGYTSLSYALFNGLKAAVEVLLRNGADPNFVGAEGSRPLHCLAMNETDDDLAEKFFQICDDIGKTLQVDAQDGRGVRPLQISVVLGKRQITEALLRRGADPNAADAEGFTALHVIVSRKIDDDCAEKLFQVCGDIQRTLRVDARSKLGKTPLHLALQYDLTNVAESLLRNGADLTLANEDGRTPLHLMCIHCEEAGFLVKMLFELSDERKQPLRVDARDKFHWTPLHYAAHRGLEEVTELLLRRGADPNLAGDRGATALHVICIRPSAADMAEIFFKMNDDIQQAVQIDVQDKLGNTPLHIAVLTEHKDAEKLIELLLRRGANANLANIYALTPLLIICMRYWDEDLAELFFKICDEVRQSVQIDVRDKSGHTPLQWAVSNFLSNTVDLLLNRGADLSSFVFPTEKHFNKNYRVWLCDDNFKLTLASGLMAVVERLENRGYELERSDALTIMKLFHNYELFEKAADLDECWYDNEDFATKAKEIKIYPRIERFYYDDESEFDREKNETMMSPSLSIYDLVRLRPKEAAKLLTYEHYFELAHPKKLNKPCSSLNVACLVHLCEKLSKRFFRAWARIFFAELIHYRLPDLCCEIIDQLMNQDLYHICLAAVGKSSSIECSPRAISTCTHRSPALTRADADYIHNTSSRVAVLLLPHKNTYSAITACTFMPECILCPMLSALALLSLHYTGELLCVESAAATTRAVARISTRINLAETTVFLERRTTDRPAEAMPFIDRSNVEVDEKNNNHRNKKNAINSNNIISNNNKNDVNNNLSDADDDEDDDDNEEFEIAKNSRKRRLRHAAKPPAKRRCFGSSLHRSDRPQTRSSSATSIAETNENNEEDDDDDEEPFGLSLLSLPSEMHFKILEYLDNESLDAMRKVSVYFDAVAIGFYKTYTVWPVFSYFQLYYYTTERVIEYGPGDRRSEAHVPAPHGEASRARSGHDGLHENPASTGHVPEKIVLPRDKRCILFFTRVLPWVSTMKCLCVRSDLEDLVSAGRQRDAPDRALPSAAERPLPQRAGARLQALSAPRREELQTAEPVRDDDLRPVPDVPAPPEAVGRARQQDHRHAQSGAVSQHLDPDDLHILASGDTPYWTYATTAATATATVTTTTTATATRASARTTTARDMLI
ncbi:unnamed protein product [Trichogramma brassicae]|uniref:F-box domain-containing protein n=1 Tax=Trichogramma brassicae TaxID=86971 RepID=A0A6H5IPS2_9HYME|nr:unnamed protein product [Trichogramma brassicae]